MLWTSFRCVPHLIGISKRRAGAPLTENRESGFPPMDPLRSVSAPGGAAILSTIVETGPEEQHLFEQVEEGQIGFAAPG